MKSAEAFREERRDAWLLGRGRVPSNAPSTRAGRGNSSQTRNAAESTSSRTENSQPEASQPEASQPVYISDRKSVASRVLVPTVSQKRRRPPLAEKPVNEVQSLTALPDSQFGRKRRRPIYFDP
jgi:hypothetical protein